MKRLLGYLLGFELAYLALVNAALYLPLTQDIVNLVRPEKFHVQWQRAWSWYPFRVHAIGVAANGQSRTQQWQLSAERASASVSVLPLILKRVWLRDVQVENVRYHQRPRLRPDRDYSRQLPLFPPIEGREPAPVDLSEPASKWPWHVAVRDFVISGSHRAWVYQAQGELQGSAAGSLTSETRGGEFSLDLHQLSLALSQVHLSEDYPVFERGSLQGSLGFAPFLLRENRGVRLMRHLSADLTLDAEPVTLAFLNLFMLDVAGIDVDGKGAVQGQLRIQRGEVLPGTDLQVSAPELAVRVAEHDITGLGGVALRLGPETHGELDLSFHFDEVALAHRQADGPLLLGENLVLTLGGNGRFLPGDDGLNRSRSLRLQLQDLAVPDVSRLQRYLPPKWPLDLRGGEGRLSGHALLAPTSLDLALHLLSDNATAAVHDYVFQTDIDAALMLQNPDLAQRRTRADGSYIRLIGAQVERDGMDAAAPWEAHLMVQEGRFGVLPGDRKQADDVAVDLLQQLADTEAKQLLGDSRGEFRLDAGISDLAWLGLFLGGAHNTRVTGEGTLSGLLHLESGLPAPGTDLEVLSDRLGFHFLDFVASGDGRVALQVAEGGEAIDWQVGVQLSEGQLRRRDETLPTVTGAALSVQALARDVTLEGEARDLELRLQIDSATVEQMTVFNRYIPAQTPLRFTGGSADLAADIRFWPQDAQGWLRLEAHAVQASLDEQQLQGALRADVQVVGGVPRDMQFEIDGSTLRLDEVRVRGDRGQFSDERWSAVLELEQASTRWRAPLRLDAELALQISDSRPLVAVFENGGWRPGFLSEMLTVEDIAGRASLRLADDTLLVPAADIAAERIAAGARGVFSGERRQGVFYLRYRKASALLKIDGDTRKLDVLRAKEKYLGYTPGGPLP